MKRFLIFLIIVFVGQNSLCFEAFGQEIVLDPVQMESGKDCCPSHPDQIESVFSNQKNLNLRESIPVLSGNYIEFTNSFFPKKSVDSGFLLGQFYDFKVNLVGIIVKKE